MNRRQVVRAAASAVPMAAVLLAAGCSIFGGGSSRSPSPPTSAGTGDSLAVAAGDSLDVVAMGPFLPDSVSAPQAEPRPQKPRAQRPRPVAPNDPVEEIKTIEPSDTLAVSPVRVTAPVTIEARTRLDRQITHDLLDTRDHLRRVAPSRLSPEQQHKVHYVEDLMMSVGVMRPTDLEGAARLARKAMLIARELSRAR